MNYGQLFADLTALDAISAVICILGFVVVVVLMIAAVLEVEELYEPGIKYEGDWIAECWIEWVVSRGSTFYRQRFKYKWQAYVFARIYAYILDCNLPRHYKAEYSNGVRYSEPYEYEICYGVRKIVPGIKHDGYPLWTVHLPGNPKFKGEHPTDHPTYLRTKVKLKSLDRSTQ